MTESVSKRVIKDLTFQNTALIEQNLALQFSIKKNEDALEKLNLFFDFTALGCIVLDSDKRIIELNTATSQLLEQPISALIHTDFLQFVPKKHKFDFEVFLKKTIGTTQKQSCKIKLVVNNATVLSIDFVGIYFEKKKQHLLTMSNVTKKVNCLKQIKQSDFFYNETQRLGQIGSFKLNITQDVYEISDTLRAIFGIEKGTVINFRIWNSMIHEDDKNEMELYAIEKITDHTTWNKEYRIKRKSDGTTRWINSKGAFNKNPRTQEIILFGAIQDITDRKVAEEKIKNAEIRSHGIFKSSKEGILILDGITGQITDANPSLIEMIGFNYEELVGKELWEIGVFKNIAASKEAFIELQNKEYIRFENMPLETKAGQSIDVEFVSNVFIAEQKKVILCHIRDISDRKKIDEALKVSSQLYFAMFEKNQAVQLLIDPADGNIIDANSAAARFYGYSLAQFKLMNLNDITPFSAERVLDKLSNFGLSGQSYFQFMHQLASGETCDIEIYTSLIQIGKKELLISTINDITKRKLEEKRVNQLNHQLKEVNLLKSQFISTVSHEFRTPLAGILSSVQLLKIYHDSWDKVKKEKMYKQIFDAVQQTKSLLDDVSLIDKAQNSHSFFRPIYIELIPLINEIIEENLGISETSHSVILNNNSSIQFFFMDPSMIRHILNNLLSNAIKYSFADKIITLDVDEINSSEIKITLKDQGIGIPANEIKYLLEPFYRASNTGAVKGSGFGMSIVKRFVELHKGQIFVESVMNEGTKVTLILPFLKEKL